MQPHSDPPWDPGDGDADNGVPRVTLNPHERTLLCQAATELGNARAADLTTLDTPGLIRMVERLRSSLDDTVQLLRNLQS